MNICQSYQGKSFKFDIGSKLISSHRHAPRFTSDYQHLAQDYRQIIPEEDEIVSHDPVTLAFRARCKKNNHKRSRDSFVYRFNIRMWTLERNMLRMKLDELLDMKPEM